MTKEVGRVSAHIVSLLGSTLQQDQPIYLGTSNIAHMQKRHPHDYAKYGRYISQILAQPDYVGENPKDGSIEYVKEFMVEKEYVKIAIRISGNGALFVRSLYVLNQNRVKNFIAKGTLKKV